MKIAVTTKNFKGLEDEVSEDFARSPTITIVEVDLKRRSYRLVGILENDASRFGHGAGPVFVYILMKNNVDAVVGPSEVGMGVKELLDELKIRLIKSEAGIKVKEVIEDIISESARPG